MGALFDPHRISYYSRVQGFMSGFNMFFKLYGTSSIPVLVSLMGLVSATPMTYLWVLFSGAFFCLCVVAIKQSMLVFLKNVCKSEWFHGYFPELS